MHQAVIDYVNAEAGRRVSTALAPIRRELADLNRQRAELKRLRRFSELGLDPAKPTLREGILDQLKALGYDTTLIRDTITDDALADLFEFCKKLPRPQQEQPAVAMSESRKRELLGKTTIGRSVLAAKAKAARKGK
jgi:hypothetical protein